MKIGTRYRSSVEYLSNRHAITSRTCQFFGDFSQTPVIQRITAFFDVLLIATDLEESGRFFPSAQFYRNPVDDFAWDVLFCLNSPDYQFAGGKGRMPRKIRKLVEVRPEMKKSGLSRESPDTRNTFGSRPSLR